MDRKRAAWVQKSLKKKEVRTRKAFEDLSLYPKINGKPLMSFKQSDRT